MFGLRPRHVPNVGSQNSPLVTGLLFAFRILPRAIPGGPPGGSPLGDVRVIGVIRRPSEIHCQVLPNGSGSNFLSPAGPGGLRLYVPPPGPSPSNSDFILGEQMPFPLRGSLCAGSHCVPSPHQSDTMPLHQLSCGVSPHSRRSLIPLRRRLFGGWVVVSFVPGFHASQSPRAARTSEHASSPACRGVTGHALPFFSSRFEDSSHVHSPSKHGTGRRNSFE